jgi:hypothetical protein
MTGTQALVQSISQLQQQHQGCLWKKMVFVTRCFCCMLGSAHCPLRCVCGWADRTR